MNYIDICIQCERFDDCILRKCLGHAWISNDANPKACCTLFEEKENK